MSTNKGLVAMSAEEILRAAEAGGRTADAPDEPGSADDPSELWLALTQIPRPTKLVPVPRKMPGTGQPVGHVRIWPLTQEEQMVCNAEADRYTKQLLKDPQRRDEANLGYNHTYTNEVAIQVLYRACRDPKNLKRPAFPSPKLSLIHI